MTTVWAQEADARLRDYLASHELVAGIGTEESACSVAAINLALTEQVTDTIPMCMSEVIGQWMIVVQDAMPSEMRNSPGWKCLLPMAAGTGREREDVRLALIMDWLWGTVLPDLQSLADQGGFGAEWRTMCVEKSPDAAWATGAAGAAGDAAWAAARARRLGHQGRRLGAVRPCWAVGAVGGGVGGGLAMRPADEVRERVLAETEGGEGMTEGLQPGASSQPAGLTLRSFQLKAVALLDRALKDAAPEFRCRQCENPGKRNPRVLAETEE